MPAYPERIVCLTEETTETLYLLGAGDRVVGVSGYTARPPEARSKPKVSAFLNARFEKIEALEPDLVLGFSDLQADLARELAQRGHWVVVFNQRSVDEILRMIRMLGGLIGEGDAAARLADSLGSGLDVVRASAARLPARPRVFFEEWDDPLISGIQWVEELVEVAGGTPVFPALRRAGLARDRVVTTDAARDAAPEIVLASWCGKKVRRETIVNRPGWSAVPAVARGHLYEIKSTFILQPGPAALTEGVRQVHAAICDASGLDPLEGVRPRERAVTRL
jgi:iron complex transport system substrate-binding protein